MLKARWLLKYIPAVLLTILAATLLLPTPAQAIGPDFPFDGDGGDIFPTTIIYIILAIIVGLGAMVFAIGSIIEGNIQIAIAVIVLAIFVIIFIMTVAPTVIEEPPEF